jgi:hypothetical protein
MHTDDAVVGEKSVHLAPNGDAGHIETGTMTIVHAHELATESSGRATAYFTLAREHLEETS